MVHEQKVGRQLLAGGGYPAADGANRRRWTSRRRLRGPPYRTGLRKKVKIGSVWTALTTDKGRFLGPLASPPPPPASC